MRRETCCVSTAHRKGKDGADAGFYEVIGSTPFGNEYEFEFAKELVVYENLGSGPVTDLLAISLSPNDILGHQGGPDAPEMKTMALALDRELADFFNFLGHQIGLANVWIALSADHGISALPETAKAMHIPAASMDGANLDGQINAALTAKFSPGHAAVYVKMEYPIAWLNEEAFTAVQVKERDAETAAGEAMKRAGLRDYYTKWQLAEGAVPNTALGTKIFEQLFAGRRLVGDGSSRSIHHRAGAWSGPHVARTLTTRMCRWRFMGCPFQTGVYRTHAEPVDLAPTIRVAAGNQRSDSLAWTSAHGGLAPPHSAVNSKETSHDRFRRTSWTLRS